MAGAGRGAMPSACRIPIGPYSKMNSKGGSWLGTNSQTLDGMLRSLSGPNPTQWVDNFFTDFS
ncbi:hypothetical protein M404DRAFT_991403 [Pisolithus tinctorius Marx 270]|uniref:Uncharacterized protein n=1 Tax=Pisolithus tinctorius Marx 270 TaxID=870435 RepID=A0A0C3PZ62_PISTI|nr:hypothetical protein M404DRAFT_991403 [Pisolithus tinctorius Marx 270]